MIYKQRPRFSVFGVGPYTFSKWKVAISGLYKTVNFAALGTFEGKPIVLDDTCYFVPCVTMDEANVVAELLNSDITKTFIRALSFSDNKRPINIDLLRRIDLNKIARHIGKEADTALLFANSAYEENGQKLLVCEKKPNYKAKHSTARTGKAV